MMHELVAHYDAVPYGFKTYSLLLIPNYEWCENSGLDTALRLLEAYKRFGDIIGEKHFSGWFFRTKGTAHRIDTDIIATLGANMSTIDVLTQFVKSASGQSDPISWFSYDYERARYVCAKLGLAYNEGPFVAFFDSYPELPYFKRIGEYGGDSREALVGDKVSAARHILQFGGLPLSQMIVLLDQLEAHLLREDLSVSALQANQLLVHAQTWISSHLDSIVKIVELIANVRSPKKSAGKEK